MSHESSGDFLRAGSIEQPKKAIEYEEAELKADIGMFVPQEQAIIEKYLAKESLSRTEAETFRSARERWFEEKYGISYHSKAARQEVILRKYAPAEELRAAHELQEKMFAELGSGTSPEAAQKLKEEYLEKYPDQAEGVELVFAMRPFLELSRRLSDPDNRIESPEEVRRAYQDLTEMHFLLTHFVISNNKDKAFLNVFWSALEKIASQAKLSEYLNRIRRGTVTQIATLRVFQELGMNPTLSHPRDDAFSSIDLWSDASHAVQVKSTSAAEAEIVETDEIAFPAAEVRQNGEAKLYNSKLSYDMQRFRANVKKYGRRTHNENLKGFFIVIPYAKVDFATGEPDKELVKQIGEKIKGEKSDRPKAA